VFEFGNGERGEMGEKLFRTTDWMGIGWRVDWERENGSAGNSETDRTAPPPCKGTHPRVRSEEVRSKSEEVNW